MAFPYTGTTGVASLVYDLCVLINKYITDTANAPDDYKRLRKEVQQLSEIQKVLAPHCVENGGPEESNSTSSKFHLDKTSEAAHESIEKLYDLLNRHDGIKDADKELWKLKWFSAKRKFLEESGNIKDLKNEFATHVKTLEILRSNIQLESIQRIEAATTRTNNHTEVILREVSKICELMLLQTTSSTGQNIAQPSVQIPSSNTPVSRSPPQNHIDPAAADSDRSPGEYIHHMFDQERKTKSYFRKPTGPGASRTIPRKRQATDSSLSYPLPSSSSLPVPAPSSASHSRNYFGHGPGEGSSHQVFGNYQAQSEMFGGTMLSLSAEPSSYRFPEGSTLTSRGSILEDEGLWDENGPDPVEWELMGSRMSNIHLQYANRLDANQWEPCQLRIFEKPNGQLRLRTILRGRLWDTYITRNNTELVPQYSHFASPLILCLRAKNSRPSSPGPNIEIDEDEPIDSDELPLFRFEMISDLLVVQCAFINEIPLIDVPRVRLVEFKLTKEVEIYRLHPARLQIWREHNMPRESFRQNDISWEHRQQSRRAANLKIPTSRVVIIFSDMILTTFITDAIELKSIDTAKLRLQPLEPWVVIGKGRSIKAKTVLGISLAGTGITPDDQEDFDDFKYIEIEFNMVSDKTMFEEIYKDEIMRRRRRRRDSEDRVKRSKGGIRVASIPGAGGLACV